jgi:hypothetical protein
MYPCTSQTERGVLRRAVVLPLICRGRMSESAGNLKPPSFVIDSRCGSKQECRVSEYKSLTGFAGKGFCHALYFL